MICPYCDFDNIPGVDTCEQCQSDLGDLDEPKSGEPVEAGLIGEPVKRLHPNKAIMVTADTTIAEVIDTLVSKNIGCVLVGEGGRVEGIFSERDVLLKISHRMEEVASKPVSEFMTRDPEMLEETVSMAFALNKMSVGDFRHLPLTLDGKLEGIISLRDFLGYVFSWYPDLAET